MFLLTFLRHLWTSIKWTVGSFYYMPFKYKILLGMVVAAVYMESYGSTRVPFTWYFIYYHTKTFFVTVFKVLMPLAYIHCRLVFGTLYPAYASYKAVKTKNVKEYMKWMMYWIVFALFTAVETFADVLLSWLPFYYEIKMVFVFWLLSPVTRGSSLIYRKFVHPQLNKREKEIDEAIAQARTKGYSTLVTLGHKGLTYATNVVVTTAMKGQSTLVEQIKKSYSTNDLRVRDSGSHDNVDAPYIDDSDEEFAIIPTEVEKPKTKNKTESRLIADNKELDRREKQRHEKLHRRPLQRSKSDAGTTTRSSTRRSRPSSNLSKVEETDHESSLAHEKKESDEEVLESYSEEIIEIYHSSDRPGHYTTKQVKADPYATLPRTRSRHRPKINPHI